MDTSMTASRYPMTNHGPHSQRHHAALARLLDSDTCERLIELSGGTNWSGATCLEVGAGAGSVALMLAEAVGDAGRVVATDRETDAIVEHPRLRVVRHDLRTADPLPDGPYDLVHGRWVLEWLPQREAILDRLVDMLAPGATIFLESVAPPRHLLEEVVIDAPSAAAAGLYRRYQQAIGAVFDAAGMDPGWARRMHHALRARGLARVDTQVHGRYWTGADTGCQMVAAIVRQMRVQLRRAGMTDDELDTLLVLLDSPDLVVHGHLTYGTSGCRQT